MGSGKGETHVWGLHQNGSIPSMHISMAETYDECPHVDMCVPTREEKRGPLTDGNGEIGHGEWGVSQ